MSSAVRSLVTLAGEVCALSPEELRSLAQREPAGGYWVDIQDPDEADYALLLDGYHFHPLTIQDIREQNQRPKLDDFPSYKFVVLFTADRKGDAFVFQEHHLYLVDRAIVTIHHGPAPPLDDLRNQLADDPALSRDDAHRACSRSWTSWTSASTLSRTRSWCGPGAWAAPWRASRH